jgi:tetratricopeptide (TPR) repeat protein
MKYPLELELRQYRQAVVSGLTSSTRQQAEALSRQDDGLTVLIGGLNYVGSGLAGIENSLDELGADLARSLDVIGADLARLVTSVDSALPSVVEYLAISAKEITDISHMMATPRETKAAERYRTGTMALAKAQQPGSPARAQQWYDHAVHDLREAVDIHQYHPRSWFNLGIALGRLGRTEEAAEAFANSAFFGVDQSLEFGATAVLLAAGLYRQASLRDKSAEILYEYRGQLDRCAEIHLALAEHHGASGELQRALELFPSLAADARLAGVEGAEQVAADICGRDDSTYNQLWKLQNTLYAVIKSAQIAGLNLFCPTPVRLPRPGVEALLLASAALPRIQRAAVRLNLEVSNAVSQLETVAAAAKARLEQVSRKGAVRIELTQRDFEARIAQAEIVGPRKAAQAAKEQGRQAAQAAKEQDEEILRLAERSADAAQARMQVGGMVSDQLTKLEGIIALIRPPLKRIVPFDLSGHLAV